LTSRPLPAKLRQSFAQGYDVIRSIFLFCLLSFAGGAFAAVEVHVDAERQPLTGRVSAFEIRLVDEHALPIASTGLTLTPLGHWEVGEGRALPLVLTTDAEGRVSIDGVRIHRGQGAFRLRLADGQEAKGHVRTISALWTLLPPLLSIALALWLRQVLLALAAGVFGGAWLLYGDPLHAFLSGLTEFVVAAVSDPFHASMLVFTSALGGMVGVMSRSGGTHGVVDMAQRQIRGPRSAQLMTGALGLLIFFDDYANTLLVGNTMRPITDRMRVSREKLSYLVDCTAAPVATIAVLSTWVGYQLGLIGDGLESIGRSAGEAYTVFLSSIPYSAYSWFSIFLLFALILQHRDFGPMLQAERRTRRGGGVLAPGARPLVDDIGQSLAPSEGSKRRAHQALLPILTVIVVTALALYFDGRRSLLASGGAASLEAAGLRDLFSAADPANALLWSVMLGCVLAVVLVVGERTLSLADALESWTAGAKAMFPALCILVLAWSIGGVCAKLGTANVVVDAATGHVSARWVPTITFIVAAFLGFSTGTSWGTMAILMPIVIPLAHALPVEAGLGEAVASGIVLASIASVLSGSVLGDHCSPISDTTIMSSMASGADHVDHVRTQLPYAITAGTVAVVCGSIPAGFGISPWITLPVGAGILWLVVRQLGGSSEVT
jgi:Na+/H+ antiporter NhaC